MEFIMNNLNLLAENVSFALGSLVTLRLSKMRLTKQLWNKTIEPYFVDLIDNTVGAFINGFISGLRSDD